MSSQFRYSDEKRAEAVALCAKHGPREAGRRTGIHFTTISKWAKAEGITSGTEQTRNATEARVARAQEKRSKLMLGLLEDAERLRAQLFAPAVAYNFGGRDNTYEEHTLAEPDAKSKQAIMNSISRAIDKSLALEKHDAEGDQGMAAVDAWLRAVTGS